MKQSKTDRVVVGAVTSAAGLLFAGIGLYPLIGAVRQDSRVGMFVLGLVLLFAGAGHLTLHRSQRRWRQAVNDIAGQETGPTGQE